MNRQYCHGCSGEVAGASLYCGGKLFHRNCLRCESCEKWLRYRHIVKKSDKVYCSDCHQRLFGKYCKCCKEPILDDYKTHGNDVYHIKCFRCEDCNDVIGASHYLYEGRILCKSDYIKNYKTEWEKSGTKIVKDEYNIPPSFNDTGRYPSKISKVIPSVDLELDLDFSEKKLEKVEKQKQEQKPAYAQEKDVEDKLPKHSKILSALCCILGPCF